MKKFVKWFFMYSYVTLFAYVFSEQLLVFAEYYAAVNRGSINKHKCKLTIESIWIETAKRLHKAFYCLFV